MQEIIRCFKWFLNNVILSTLIVCIVLVMINICLSHCTDMQRNLYSSRSDICVREIININDQSAFCCNQLNDNRTILFTGFFSPCSYLHSLLSHFCYCINILSSSFGKQFCYLSSDMLCIYIYIYIYIYTHTHMLCIYIYIHTHTYIHISQITEDLSSGSLVQCFAKNYKNNSTILILCFRASQYVK